MDPNEPIVARKIGRPPLLSELGKDNFRRKSINMGWMKKLLTNNEISINMNISIPEAINNRILFFTR